MIKIFAKFKQGFGKYKKMIGEYLHIYEKLGRHYDDALCCDDELFIQCAVAHFSTGDLSLF